MGIPGGLYFWISPFYSDLNSCINACFSRQGILGGYPIFARNDGFFISLLQETLRSSECFIVEKSFNPPFKVNVLNPAALQLPKGVLERETDEERRFERRVTPFEHFLSYR